ncbi:hypothetical protein C9374_005354 [Naegleria lovaniensis]|uniref:RGS domain-containing protein n=1 Tax=Naegleria lovaniensis TaxID=51637 RepID=A0AA88GPK4_NAELO|nr:uncharacterized protein C9374_005354 [Naegleria lovaniensis]KAG2382152.1 hypothetical protein C9374_005354 [Naegleria lovaniensis]
MVASFNDKKRIIVPDDISQFDIHFEAIFDHAETFACFTNYLSNQCLNSECSDFLQSVNEFRKIKHERKRLQMATKMYEKFMADASNSQLNLRNDFKMRIYKVVYPNSQQMAPSNSGASLDQFSVNEQIHSDVQLPTVKTANKNTQSSRSNSSGSGAGVGRNSLDSTSSSSSNSLTNGSATATSLEANSSPIPLHGSTVTCPKNLFDEVESLVLLQLKENHFAAFLSSEHFKNFLKKQPLQLLYEIGSLKSDSLLQFVESLSETMKCENFTLHDFRFIKKQFSNYEPDEWEIIGSSQHHKCYMSKRTYDMGESVGLSFFKFDVTFPFSAKQVMNTFFEQEYRYEYDGELNRIEQLAYYEKKISNNNNNHWNSTTNSVSPQQQPQQSQHSSTPSSPTTSNSPSLLSSPSHTLNHPSTSTTSTTTTSTTSHVNATSILLATSLTQEIYKLVWPFSPRDFIVSSSGLYDLGTKTYLMGKKSCLSEKAKKPEKNVVRAFSFGGWAFKEIDDKTTQYSQMFYMDLKGNIPKPIIKSILKDRAKHFMKVGTKFLKLNEKRGFICNQDNFMWKTIEENGAMYL